MIHIILNINPLPVTIDQPLVILTAHHDIFFFYTAFSQLRHTVKRFFDAIPIRHRFFCFVDLYIRTCSSRWWCFIKSNSIIITAIKARPNFPYIFTIVQWHQIKTAFWNLIVVHILIVLRVIPLTPLHPECGQNQGWKNARETGFGECVWFHGWTPCMMPVGAILGACGHRFG